MEKNLKVQVIMDHPHGRVEIPLEEWILRGPGKRNLLRPVGALDKLTGNKLPLKVIPLRYRNNTFSKVLIAVGLLPKPWKD